MSYRVKVTFEITGTATHVLSLYQAAQTETGKTWIRHLLVSALETFLKWTSGASFWRFDIGEATVSKPEAVPTSAPEPMPDQAPA